MFSHFQVGGIKRPAKAVFQVKSSGLLAISCHYPSAIKVTKTSCKRIACTFT